MAGIITERFRLIQSLNWQPGQLIGAQVSNFRQIKYFNIPNAVPDFDQALSGAKMYCGRDIHKQIIEYSKAVKVWIKVQGKCEPVHHFANKQPVEQYLSASPTRIFMCDEIFLTFKNHYVDSSNFNRSDQKV